MHIEHVAIWTRKLEEIKSFYETYFGASAGPRYVNPAHQFESYFLAFEGGARLELMRMPSIPDMQHSIEDQFLGLIHLAFSVGSQERVEALTARVRADGYQVLDGPRWTGDGYYESVVLDPDGNRIEITI